MSKLFSKIQRFVSLTMVLAFCAITLSACASNHTPVAGWWYDQQWESASAADSY